MSEPSRDELIAICEAATVPQEHWNDRDSASAQRQVGEAWALLKAGCAFRVDPSMDDFRGRTIWLEIKSEGFDHKEYGELDISTFYLPSRQRLDEANGKDWY